MFSVTPITMISAPNQYAPIPGGMFSVVSPNAQTLWFVLNITDVLGTRPYSPQTGSTLQLIFQRMDSISKDGLGRLSYTSQSINKLAASQALNSSLWSVDLTALDVQNLVSGTIKFVLTEGATETTFVQNWLITKKLTSPGN